MSAEVVPRRANSEFDAGVASYHNARFADAALHFRRAVEIAPNWTPAWINLGESELKGGNAKRAFAAFRAASALAPNSPEPWLGLALSLNSRGMYRRALVELSKAVELGPDNSKYWAALADTLFENGKPAQAIAAAEKAILLAPKSGDAHFTRGKLALKTGDISHAITSFTRSVAIDPLCSPSHHNLGASYFRSGDFEAALRCQLAALRFLRPASALPAMKKLPNFDSDRGIRAITALREALEPFGIQFFLAFGTLLGAIREDAFLRHDKDIDIGIFSSTDPDIVEQAFQNNARFVKQDDFRPSDQQFTIYFDGLAVDFFRHRLCGDRIVCGFNPADGGVEWSLTAFELNPYIFRGVHCHIPSNAELYLEELYGSDWRRPRLGFDPITSSPARLRNGNDAGGLYLAYNKVYMALLRGDVTAARELLSQLASRGHHHEFSALAANEL